MSWANVYIAELQQGRAVSFRPKGRSMTGLINHNQLVTVTPIIGKVIAVDDIVLCKVKGAHYLHIVKAVKGESFLIGNNRGRINGWTTGKSVYGKVLKVHDN